MPVGKGACNWEAAAAKASGSKFKPRPFTKVDRNVPVVPGVVPRGAAILIIQQPWISLILQGHKTLEIRGGICKKPTGERVYLALSGSGGYLLGSVEFVKCHGPLQGPDYVARGAEHCVAGDALPYGAKTYAWQFRNPQRFKEPVPYNHKPGSVIWSKY